MSFPGDMGNYLCFPGRLVLGDWLLGVADAQPGPPRLLNWGERPD